MITDISGVPTYTLLGVSPPADAPCGAAGNELAWTKVWRPDQRGKVPTRYNPESAGTARSSRAMMLGGVVMPVVPFVPGFGSGAEGVG
jgi:hypothetical protein